MLKHEFACAVLAALVSVSVLGASGLATSPASAGGAALAAEPCPPILTEPPPSTPTPAPSTPTPAPAPPKNLRIIRGGADEAFYQPESDVISGPYVGPEVPEPAPALASHAYFDLLKARADCLTSFHFRNQASIDSLASRGDSGSRLPIVYSTAHDAATFAIDPSGSLPNSGSTSTPQKRMPVGIQGATTLLITWDMKIAGSMRWFPSTDVRTVNGESRTVGYLDQHKSHRVDDSTAEPWVGMKQNYARGTNRGLGIAYVFFNARPTAMGPGTTQGSSEMISPAVGEFYVQPDVWTRVWIFVEGNIGVGDNAVQLSIWLADEHRAPVQLYDRVNMISPVGGIGLFRYEFNSSTAVALNGPGQQYQRNWVALKGVPRAEMSSLLQKPVN